MGVVGDGTGGKDNASTVASRSSAFFKSCPLAVKAGALLATSVLVGKRFANGALNVIRSKTATSNPPARIPLTHCRAPGDPTLGRSSRSLWLARAGVTASRFCR